MKISLGSIQIMILAVLARRHPLARAGIAAGFLILGTGIAARAQEAEKPQAPAAQEALPEPGEEVVPAAGNAPGPEEVVVPVEGVYKNYSRPEVDKMADPVVRNRDIFEKSNSNLTEILESIPGVAVLESGGDEGPWMVSLRGDQGPGAAVYLDGILLNDPYGRVPDLSGIPAALVDQVVVYRGGDPSGYPLESTAGVVDIRTRPASAVATQQARLSFDSLNASGVSAVVTGRAMNGSGMAAVSYEGGPGKFAYRDDRGTFFHKDDDRNDERANNEYSDYDVMLKWDRKASAFRLYTGGYYRQRFHDLPGQGFQEAAAAEEKNELVMGYVGIKRPGLLLPELDAEFRVHALQERTWFNDSDAELGPARDDFELRTRTGADVYFDYYGLRYNTIALYFGLANDERRPESGLDPKTDNIACSRSSVYFTAMDEISLVDGRIKLKPRIRYLYQGNSYQGSTLAAAAGEAADSTSHINTSLDFSAGFMLVDGLWILANTGQHYRPPGFGEEFGDRVNIYGNSSLAAESGLFQELALVYDRGPFWRFDNFWAQFSYYEKKLNDRIAWTDKGGGLIMADNVGGVSITGIELALSLNARDLVAVDASYAWQEATNEAEKKLFSGNDFPAVPRNKANLTATLYQSYGRLYYKGDYQDVRYLDEANTIPTGPRLVHSLGLSYYSDRWSLGFEAKNLGNDQSYEVLGYPLPGTRYLIFMEVKG